MRQKRILLALLVTIIVASVIPLPALAKDVGMVSGTEYYGRIDEEGLLLEVQNGSLHKIEGEKRKFSLEMEVLSYEVEIDMKGNVLIHLMPIGDAIKELPGRGFTEKKYPRFIGRRRKNHPNVCVWGFIASHKTRKHRHGWKEHKYLTAGGQGFACKSRLENDGRTLHVVIYGAIF